MTRVPRLFQKLAPILLAAGVGACVGTPTPPTACPGLDPAAPAAVRTDRLAAAVPAGATPEAAVAGAVADLFAPDRLSLRRVEPVRVLALSTGGQWAAFGSGFMEGWTRNPAYPRPRFDVATGASAGATVAPAALLGPAYDAALPFAGPTDVAGLARQRPLLAIPFGNSVFDVSGLEAQVRGAIDDYDLLPALAQARTDGQRLLAGAVDLRSTRFRVFDLTAYAAGPDPRPACLAETVLASAAIPTLFPPRNIDGTLYADAGLRSHVFLGGIEEARRRAGSARPVEAWVIVNGDLRAPEGEIDESIVSLSLRAFSIVTDEGLRQSLHDVLDIAGRRGWTVRAAFGRDVDISTCMAGGAGVFDRCVVRLLRTEGLRLGATMTEDDWLTEDELRRVLDGLNEG